ncbi:metalloregulator ArsR/SmtB family transcription factor [Actinomycetaceae bacterium TAE3-ERU4]|nr:metalloregulator ArsR/SmtB family transcription factor [Actinomycetaceae bacterium TAE3-ERU4]
MQGEFSKISEGEPVVVLFKALAHPIRASIVRKLTDCPTDVTEFTELLGISQPLVSHHLRILRDAHLVEITREGRNSSYRLIDEHVAHIFLDALKHTQEHENDCKH